MVSLLIVGAAAALLLKGRLGKRKPGFERGRACALAATSGPLSQSVIVFRARKGQRPEVLVKMK